MEQPFTISASVIGEVCRITAVNPVTCDLFFADIGDVEEMQKLHPDLDNANHTATFVQDAVNGQDGTFIEIQPSQNEHYLTIIVKRETKFGVKSHPLMLMEKGYQQQLMKRKLSNTNRPFQPAETGSPLSNRDRPLASRSSFSSRDNPQTNNSYQQPQQSQQYQPQQSQQSQQYQTQQPQQSQQYQPQQPQQSPQAQPQQTHSVQQQPQSSQGNNRVINDTKQVKPEDKNLLKVCIVGDGAVGKSTLTVQFIHGYYTEEYDPTIEDAYRKQIEVDGVIAHLDILDTAGQEEYSGVADHYMRSGEGFMLNYSTTSRHSFSVVEEIHAKILRIKEGVKTVPMVLIGNKCDMTTDREVTFEEGKKLAASWGVAFMETSAKNNINVHEAFFQLVREVRKVRDFSGVFPLPTNRKDIGKPRIYPCVIF
jgi:GTPase KRas protein